MFLKKNLEAFTLVELIVVITIVGILSTVGFVSYSGYLTGARDSNRISQLTKLSDSLQVYAASKTLPLPDNAINITASGSTNIIGYQGYLGVDVLETIDYTNGGKDPKDDTYFTYYLTKDRKNMQLLAFMEDARTLAFTSQTQAADYSERFPKTYGKKLGVLTEPITNTPVQEVSAIVSGSGYLDIVKTISQYVAHISDNETLVGTGTIVQGAIPNASCKRIKQMGGAGQNGTYTINPGGIGEFEVYCDMETSSGGWNLIASKVSGGMIAKGNFGIQIVNKGTNTSAIITDAHFRNQLTEAMACSSTSCWKWNIQTTFRNCLVNGCSATAEANTLTKVSGTSTLNVINGTSIMYNIIPTGSVNAATSFHIYESTTIGIESSTTRRPMNGTGALATWVAGDYWELYVK